MIIGRRRNWRGLIRSPKNILYAVAILITSFAVAGGAYQVYVQAEGPDDFLPVLTAGNWKLSTSSPDQTLNWAYNDAGKTAEEIEHVLKNEKSSVIRRLNLKIYYDSKPAEVRFVTRAPYCKLDGSTALGSQLRVSVTNEENGSTDVTYQQNAHREGLYNASAEYKGYVFDADGKIDDNPNANGNTNPNARWDWKLTPVEPESGKNAVFQSDAVPSRICNPAPGPLAGGYRSYDFEEQCGDWADQANKICDNNGNERWQTEGSRGPYGTNDPGNSCPSGGCQIAGYTHVASGDRARLDRITGKWVATVTVELTGGYQNTEEFITGKKGDPNAWTYTTTNVQHQVRLKLDVAGGGSIGYGKPVGPNPNQQFGLGADIGANDTIPDGIKLATPFGLPCDQSLGDGPRRIYLYDIDSDTFGGSYVRVFQRDPMNPSVITAAPEGAYTSVVNGARQSYGPRVRLADGQNGTGSFDFDMQYGVQYMAVVINPKNDNKASPIRNVFSLHVPTESIYGVVNCKIELTPYIQPIAPSFSYNPDFAIDGGISSNGGAPGGAREWRVTRLMFDKRPVVGHTALADNFDDPCVHMATGNAASSPSGCTNMSGSKIYPDESVYGDSFSDTADYPAGKTICFMTSIKKPKWDSDADTWRHSGMTCSYSAIKPKVQVWGGDVKSGSVINTSLTQISGTGYGSWGEYGIASNGRSVGMASGSGLLGGSTSTQSGWSKLTFSNSLTPIFGNFGGVLPLAYNPGASTESNCTLGARTYNPGEKAVIQCAGGTLTITDNQTFANGPYASVSAIPNIKIVADNIIIGKDVARVDPWLVARSSAGVYGRITTCGEVTAFAQLNSGVCNTRVKFNGPVAADRLYLFRTADDKQGVDAAETFNLRADHILSAYGGSGVDQPVARTEQITELPPRF